MIQRIIGLLAFVGVSFIANGQFSDDFSDGNLNGWAGDIDHYIINANEQLQLNAPSGSTSSIIYTPVVFADSMVWELYLMLDFAPSTSNQLQVYLAVNSPEVDTATGYLLEIGASGDQDALVLKYLASGVDQIIAMSEPALVANQPVELSLRVTRDRDGNWTVHDTGDVVPELLFAVDHTTTPLPLLGTFGILTRYSETRRDKFFFDNINLYPPQPDVTAPEWLSLTVIDQQTLELTFSEPILAASANDPTHYQINPLGNPDQITLNANRNVITLHWPAPFVSLQQYSLLVDQLRDDAGNLMSPSTRNFTYIQVEQALPYELLITEIMADPTPVIALPDAEYIEIFNATNKTFRLADYTLRVGASERALPEAVLLPNTYVILADEDHAASFSSFGTAIGIANMPSLTNSGTTIALLNVADEIIHEVSYTDEWYANSSKAEGGWSLEMKNPNAVCSDAANWSASESLAGGTPGTVNSIWAPQPDETGPALVSLFPSTPTTLVLRFSERLDGLLMENPNAYQIQPGIIVDDATLIDAGTLQLTLAQPLQQGTTYTLLPFQAFDCLGNGAWTTDTLEFGLIVDAQPGDVLINEILFNPATGGSRFIEVINQSEHFINLSTLAIGRLTMQQQDIYITGTQEVLRPGEIAAFTPDRDDILARYSVPKKEKLYTATVPSWDDERDNVSLLVNGVVIDSFTYDASWHHPVIADDNGVSLERVSLSASTALSSNWHSASSLSGYATPTGTNSQLLGDTITADAPFTIINRVFSPNEDGFKDYLVIQFESSMPDAIISAWIYDMEGRSIFQLANNELVGTTSLLQWDGRNAEGKLADMGMYIVFVQLWRVDGNVSEYQSSCALVKR